MARRSPAPPARGLLAQPVARIGDRLVGASQLPADAPTRLSRVIAAGELLCVCCGSALRLEDAEQAFAFRHIGEVLEHDPETTEHHRARRLIAGRLAELFPSAAVEEFVDFPDVGCVADLAMVTPRGAKLVVEIAGSQITGDRYRELVSGLARQGIASLWFLSLDMFAASGKADGPSRKLKLGELETAILGEGELLMFVDPAQRQLITARPHPGALALARAGELKLGLVECLLRRYPLSQLRLRAGAVCLITDYDPPAPPPGPLPKLLQRKLERIRAD